jgi:hypothetical protein
MENKPDQNLFREVHRQVQDLRDKARRNRADAVQDLKAAEDEAQKKEILDRPASTPSDGSQ